MPLTPDAHKTTRNFFTTGEAADICCVTPDAVLKWIKAGKIPANRTPGGHYRIHRDDLPILLATPDSPAKIETDQRPFQYCWEYNAGTGEIHEHCRGCVVYRARASRCYEMSQLPSAAGHARHFCTKSCETCEYYQLVKSQRLNLLVVTDQASRYGLEENDSGSGSYNLRFSNCEYNFSMLVGNYRPDYVIIDCKIGPGRAREFARNVSADPRLPFVRVIMVGGPREFPRECDKEVFASVRRPFDISVLEELIENLRRESSPAPVSHPQMVSSGSGRWAADRS